MPTYDISSRMKKKSKQKIPKKIQIRRGMFHSLSSSGKSVKKNRKKKERRAAKKKAEEVVTSGQSVEANAQDDSEELREYEKLPLDVVVKVFASLTDVSYLTPWSVEQSQDVTGSGFVFRGMVITNAHVVANATYVAVRKSGDARKYKGQVCKLSSVNVPALF